MNRRDFLRRTSLALAGGLVVGDAVLETYERLTHRKVFALGAVSEPEFDPVYIDGKRINYYRSRKVYSGELYVSGAALRRMKYDKRIKDAIYKLHGNSGFNTIAEGALLWSDSPRGVPVDWQRHWRETRAIMGGET